MTQRISAPPVLPQPPRGNITPQYMDSLINALNFWLAQSRNPGPVRATTVTITDLPTSATGLEPGTLWNDAGSVKVA